MWKIRGVIVGGGKVIAQWEASVMLEMYEATITEDQSGKKETYTGVSSRPFKKRLYEHNTDMNNPGNRTNSGLSSHVWSLKDRGIKYSVTWKLKDRSTRFQEDKCRQQNRSARAA